MQKVAAYLLERRDAVETSDKRASEINRLLGVLQEWLKKKDAKELNAEGGTFISETGPATYRWERAEAQGRSWRLLRLEETSQEGKRFTTAVSITDTGAHVAVYISLEAGLAYSTIAPISIQPRCPRCLRSMLDLGGDWYHGATKFEKCRRLTGTEAGKWVAKEILAKERTIPIVLLSEDEGKILIPKLDEHLAFDLAGLANVFVLDHDAAWGLTDGLGTAWSCYWGAIRVYWPHVDQKKSPYHHPIWTANKLLRNYEDLGNARERFREQLRRMLMGVSALTVLRPREIDEIRGAVGREQIAELERNAASIEDYRKLAEEYSTEKDRLRERNDQLIEELRAAQTSLQNEQVMAPFRIHEALDFEPEKESDDGDALPTKGEIRFYKKKHSTGPYDVLIPIADCGHQNWQRAHKAHKAQKGVARLEGTREWKSFLHCGTCDGGGVWKVQW